MPVWLIFVILLSAFFHASWNSIVKFPKDTLSSMGLLCFFCFLISLSLVGFFPLPEKSLWLFILASVSVHFVYKCCLVKAYQLGDFGLVYPVARGIAPLFFLLLSLLIFSIEIDNKDFLAILFISLPIIFMSGKIGNFLKKDSLIPLLFAFLVGFCISIYSIIDSTAVIKSSYFVSYIIWVYLLDNGIFFLFCYSIRKKKIFTTIQQKWYQGFLGAFLYMSAYGIVVFAFSVVEKPVLIASLRETSILFGVLFSVWLHKETLGMMRFYLACVILVGIILLKL